MADLKISELTNLTAADPANDMIPIVDVSATPPASGSTKRISINNILACSPTATLASATISGDLTVDTSTLKVDSANNRVGIGTATPARPLDIVGSFQSSLGWVLTGTPAGLGAATRYIGGASTTDSWYFNALTGGNHLWAFGESLAMTLNSTGLGVGVGPAYQIHTRKDQAAFTTVAIDNQNAIAAGTGTQFLLIDGGVNAGWFRRNRDGSGNTDIGYKDALRFRGQIAGTERTDLTIDSSGNVGIGVTPSAWASIYKTVEFANGSSIWGQTDIPQLSLQTNAFLNSSFQWIYKTAAAASNYRQTAGEHLWFTAPSGSINTQIGFNERLRLKEPGQLRFVPRASDPAGAEAGDVYYNSTSNKLKCYNGTTWNDLF